MQSTTQQVRQILVNELGLTRESVREEAEKYIAQTLMRMLGDSLPTLVSKEVERIIGERINTWNRQPNKLQEMIELEVRQAIIKRLNVELKGSVTVAIAPKTEQFLKITDPKDYQPSDCKQHITVTFDILRKQLGDPFYNGTDGFPDSEFRPPEVTRFQPLRGIARFYYSAAPSGGRRGAGCGDENRAKPYGY